MWSRSATTILPVLSGCAASSGTDTPRPPPPRPPKGGLGVSAGSDAVPPVLAPAALVGLIGHAASSPQDGGGLFPPEPRRGKAEAAGGQDAQGRKREARPLRVPGLPAAASHESAASVGEFPLVSVYEKRAESGLRETKGKKTDWDMGRGKKRP